MNDTKDPDKIKDRLEAFLRNTRLSYRFVYLGHDTHTMRFWAADDQAANLVSSKVIPLVKK